jgi:uncharacterized phage protein (TIGR02218 family)
MTPFTFARSVSAVASRRVFTVNGVAQADDYFRGGRVTFTSGDNNGHSREIKGNVGNLIELQLPMTWDVAIGNNLSLIAGYDGTRDMARDRFGAAANGQFEPDLPGLNQLLTYPPGD